MTAPSPLDRLTVGVRAVVRHRVGDQLADALGDVVALDDSTVTVQTRRGARVIPRGDVVAAKEVPPAPARRGAAHRALSMDDLQRLMVDGWPPTERQRLGGWLLRAGGGFTGRANSVLPTGDPGLPLSRAVDEAQGWYDARDLRRLFTCYGPEGFAVTDDPLGVELLGRGCTERSRTLVMTASADTLAATAAEAGGRTDATRVRLEPAPSPDWWITTGLAARAERASAPAAAEAIVTGSPEQLFLLAELDGRVAGAARVAFAHVWAGVFAVRVTPELRRRGIGRALMQAAADATRARGIRSVYLQVERESTAAVALYERLTFSTHHEYVYLAG